MEQNPFKIEKEPFKVPENYWEDLEQQILVSIGIASGKIKKQPTIRRFLFTRMTRLQLVAASLAVLIAFGSIFYVSLPEKVQVPDSSDYLTYAIVHVDEFDWPLLEANYVPEDWEDLELQIDGDVLEAWMESEQWPVDWSDDIIEQ